MSELKSYFLNAEIPAGLVRVVCASGHEAAIAERDAEIKRLRKLLSLDSTKCCETCQHNNVDPFDEPCFRCADDEISQWELKEAGR